MNTKTKVICVSGKAQHGKDTYARILREALEKRGKKVLVAHYADLVKYVCTTFFNWDGNKDESGRTLLQKVGTDVVRAQQPDYWVNFIRDMLLFFDGTWDFVIIPDTRFPNEIAVMSSTFPTYHCRVVRYGFESNLTDEQKNHPSETSLDNYPYDILIPNEGDDMFLITKVGESSAQIICGE